MSATTFSGPVICPGGFVGDITGAVTGNVTGNVSGSAASLATTNWTIAESGGKLVFSYGGVAKFSLTSAGLVVAANDVTAYGTP